MLIAVLAALGAAFATGAASIIQQRRARRESSDESLRLSLLVDLVRQPMWLAGIGLAVLGFGLQGLALAFGALALVQPILVIRLVFAVAASSKINDASLSGRAWAALGAVVVGVGGFLFAASPSEGVGEPSVTKWLWMLAGVAVVLAIVSFAARGPSRRAKATLLALGAGTLFAVLSAFINVVVEIIPQGLGALVTSWEPYALAVAAIAGTLYQQSAYQAGTLAAARPAIDVSEPFISVIIGITVLGEQMRSGVVFTTLQLLFGAIAVAGIIAVDLSPAVEAMQEEEEEELQHEDGGDDG